MGRKPMLCLAMLATVSCSPSAETSHSDGAKKVQIKSDGSAEDNKRILGDYPTSKHVRQVDQVSNDAFEGKPVPCSDDRAIADALWEYSRRQLDPAGEPKMVDYGVDDVALKDGPGQIAAVEYAFKPGDPGVISRAADLYLLNRECRVKYWAYVDY